MSEQSPSKQTRLAAAAEALVEAASLEVDAATKKKLVDGLDALKSSLDENLNRVVQKMQSSNEDFDAKINSLSQHVDGAKAEVSAIRNDVATIKSLLEEDRKQKILTRAFESIDILLKHREVPHDCHSTAGSFNFISHDGLFNRTYKSSELAKEVLLSFMQSRGYYLPKNHALKLKSYDDDAQRSIDAQAFRNKFVEEMELLIGRKPRLSQDKNGRYIIWYS